MRRNPSTVWPETLHAMHTDTPPTEDTEQSAAQPAQALGCATCAQTSALAEIPKVIFMKNGTSLCATHLKSGN